MTYSLRYTKPLLSCSYKIHDKMKKIGELRQGLFYSAKAKLNNQTFHFRTKGVFQQRTRIMDTGTNEEIGNIQFSCWYPKATIHYKGRKYQWKMHNLWETRWGISNDDTQINFSGHSYSGSAQMSQKDEFLFLIGLFISSYYWQMAAIYAGAIIPILFIFN